MKMDDRILLIEYGKVLDSDNEEEFIRLSDEIFKRDLCLSDIPESVKNDYCKK